MRLSWYLPFRPKKAGPLRRVLAVLGPTWLASPARRLVQVLCFLAFMALFCYVCWPYTARKARAWHGWIPVEVDVRSGDVTVATEQPPDDPIAQGLLVHPVDRGPIDRGIEGNDYLGPFRVTRAAEGELGLEPVGECDAERLEILSASVGPWTLNEALPDAWPSHYADDLKEKEALPAETFLLFDPLVSISTALAAKMWIRPLVWAAAILLACLIVPRGFCSYVCPMGTLVDLFDWAVGRRSSGRRAQFVVTAFMRSLAGLRRPAPTSTAPMNRGTTNGNSWWMHLKYYLLAATLAASLFGVLIAGFVAAIAVVTRGMAFLVTPLQTGLWCGWHQVPPLGTGQLVSIGLLVALLGLGLLGPRFWCKYVCPTGAVFSVANLFRLSERKVESSCIECGKCVAICPFDAIEPDFTTRTADCTFCQACGGVCPSGAISFRGRWDKIEPKTAGETSDGAPHVGRRGFLSTALGVAAAAIGGMGAGAAIRRHNGSAGSAAASIPVRPPGSVPERQFLQLCVGCGECFQACPNDVLQPLWLEHGLEAMWTPHLAADWSGCEPSCNNCGQVCPTGAIRAVSLDEKRAARMGLAVIDHQSCLPYAGREECQLCVDECTAAGYNAIEFVRVGTEVDELGNPIGDTGFLAPVVLQEQCVGCGLCQTRCHAINVKEKHLLADSAVRIEAGDGKEDRLMSGSYAALREQEQRERRRQEQKLLEDSGGGESYLPDFLE